MPTLVAYLVALLAPGPGAGVVSVLNAPVQPDHSEPVTKTAPGPAFPVTGPS